MQASRNLIARLGWSLLAAAALTWAAGTQAQTNQTRVDVNSADLATLQSLPGIGPTLAQRIVDGRPYQTPADLEKVKGLSKSKIAALKDQITFGPSAGTKALKAAEAKPLPGTNAVAAKPSGAKAKNGTSASRTSDKLAPGQKVNINKASAKELDALPGIGVTKAQAIIDYRTQNGPFKTIEDIQKVKGIKQESFSKIKDYIKVTE